MSVLQEIRKVDVAPVVGSTQDANIIFIHPISDKVCDSYISDNVGVVRANSIQVPVFSSVEEANEQILSGNRFVGKQVIIKEDDSNTLDMHWYYGGVEDANLQSWGLRDDISHNYLDLAEIAYPNGLSVSVDELVSGSQLSGEPLHIFTIYKKNGSQKQGASRFFDKMLVVNMNTTKDLTIDVGNKRVNLEVLLIFNAQNSGNVHFNSINGTKSISLKNLKMTHPESRKNYVVKARIVSNIGLGKPPVLFIDYESFTDDARTYIGDGSNFVENIELDAAELSEGKEIYAFVNAPVKPAISVKSGQTSQLIIKKQGDFVANTNQLFKLTVMRCTDEGEIAEIFIDINDFENY